MTRCWILARWWGHHPGRARVSATSFQQRAPKEEPRLARRPRARKSNRAGEVHHVRRPKRWQRGKIPKWEKPEWEICLDRIKVSDIGFQLKGTSCFDSGRPPVADQSRSHPSGCTLLSPFRGLTIGAHHSVRPGCLGHNLSLHVLGKLLH